MSASPTLQPPTFGRLINSDSASQPLTSHTPYDLNSNEADSLEAAQKRSHHDCGRSVVSLVYGELSTYICFFHPPLTCYLAEE